MRISDDIRPKKNKIKETAVAEEEPSSIESEEGELVSIKHGEDHDFVDEDIEDQLTGKKEKAEDMSNYFYRPDKKQPVNTAKSGAFGKWLIAILILALLVIIVWQNIDSIKSYFGIKGTSRNSTDSSALYSDFSVSDAATGSAATTPASETPATTTPAATSTTTSAKSSYSISVLNGNGIKGSASGVKDTIANAGYNVTNTGNALKFTYADTIIYYKTGNAALAADIKAILTGRTCELFEDNTIAGNYDIVVVVGKT